MQRFLITTVTVCAALSGGGVLRAADAPSPADLEFFEKEVRPLLAERCYECHGPDKQKSGLRLDHISLIEKGGERGPAVVKGDVEKSLLIEAVRYSTNELQMPPKKRLDAEQVGILEKWVKLGAPWPDEPAPGVVKVESKVKPFDLEARKASHWSWKPIADAKPPRVRDAKWPLDDVDRFVLAKLEKEGLRPAPPADRATWLRRVYFDLIGLPPTPAQVEAFVKDESPAAHEKVVDELLKSPRFGERWARHWLDLVRYAETYGHEFDYPTAEAWRYRDYVIRALNADVPYDQFVREHIAGDLLDKPRLHPTEGYNESVIATGFWYFHEQTHAPTDVRQQESDRVDNQIDVMSKAFLGLTLACARCHDHKFDAISTKDYYALAGFLKSSRQQYAQLDPGGKIEAKVGELKKLRSEGDRLLTAAQPLPLPPPQEGGEVATALAKREGSDSFLFEDFSGPTYKNWFVTGWAFGDGPTRRGQWGSVQHADQLAEPGVAHSAMLGEKLDGVLRSRTFTITEPHIFVRLAGKGGQFRVIIDSFTMDAFNPLLFGGLIVPVNTDGKFVWHTVGGDYGRYIGHRAHIEILDHGDGWVAVDQIWFGKQPPAQTTATSAVATPPVAAPKLDELAEKMRAINAQLPHPVRVLAIADGTGEDNPVFLRGSHRTPGESVQRRFLEAISGPKQRQIMEVSGRLELANRMLAENNPYVARVAVNRIWHHLMGRGIVPFTDNFGVLGEPPSHPELLDSLATLLKKQGWSQKAVIKHVVLSQAYRMSSAATDGVAEKADPANILLHRMNIRRLEGEAIRDAVLAVSGRLDAAMYGPPVPIHLTPFMEGRGRPGGSGPLDGAGRRSIYVEVRRNFLSPMMLAFDTPAPFTAFGRRSVSNVPAQALILMNDPFIIEEAKRWSGRVLASQELKEPQDRVRAMYLAAFSRPPGDDELADALAFLGEQAKGYSATADNDPRVWADFAHVLLNLKEFIFVQ